MSHHRLGWLNITTISSSSSTAPKRFQFQQDLSLAQNATNPRKREARILKQLFAHRQGKTTILISHRPKVIVRADWIVMLEKGQLKTQGTPEQLRSLKGDHLD